MQKIIFVFTILLVLASCVNSQTGWVQQFYGIANPYNSVFFVDGNTGWITSGSSAGQGFIGSILKSTNGGNNWFAVYSDSINFLDIQFIDHQTGWAAGLKRQNSLYSREIFKTTNGGLSFLLQHSDATSYYPLKIQFMNTSTGYLFTANNNILKTTNSGLTWNSYTTNNTFQIVDGIFSSPDTGWIACSFSYVLKSTNGGINWSSVYGAGKIFWKSISFVNNLTGWVTDGSWLRFTSNGGSSWSDLQGGSNRIIKFINSSTGWNCGLYQSAYIRKTTNGGINWVQQTPAFFSNFTFNKLFFLNENTGWAVGSHSVMSNKYSMILKTTTGGLTPVIPISSEVPKEYSLLQNFPNPFNPVTNIRFSIPPAQNFGGVVLLKIYDMLGRDVSTLVSQNLNPGTYEVNWDALNYPSGVYIYKLTSGEFTDSKKMILLK